MTLIVLPYPLDWHSSMISPFRLMFPCVQKGEQKGSPVRDSHGLCYWGIPQLSLIRTPASGVTMSPSCHILLEPELLYLHQPPEPWTTTQQIPSRSLEFGANRCSLDPEPPHETGLVPTCTSESGAFHAQNLCPHMSLNPAPTEPVCSQTQCYHIPTQPASSCPPTAEGLSRLKPVCKDWPRYCFF